jgi:hypothetical protein
MPNHDRRMIHISGVHSHITDDSIMHVYLSGERELPHTTIPKTVLPMIKRSQATRIIHDSRKIVQELQC